MNKSQAYNVVKVDTSLRL